MLSKRLCFLTKLGSLHLNFTKISSMRFRQRKFSLNDALHSNICQKLVVIEHENIVRLLNVSIGETKLTKVSKKVACEAILGHPIKPKSGYLKKKEMPLKF